MPDLNDTATAVRVQHDALVDAVMSTPSGLIKSQMSALTSALAPVLQAPVPSSLTQENYDAIALVAGNLRTELRAYSLTSRIELEDTLFAAVQGLFHEFAPDVRMG